MRIFRNLGPCLGLAAVVVLLAAWPAASQMQMQMPSMPKGVFNPVVGNGAAYEMDTKSGKTQMEISIVGKEDVAGKSGYWMEMAMTPSKGGQIYVKDLMAFDGSTMTITRMIMQMAGQQPMDMTSMMSMNRQQKPPEVDARKQAMLVGSESITVPAGTFDCQHYRANDGSWDAWLSTKVSPWGLVKSVNNGSNDSMTMVLVRQITNATDHITGTPQQMDLQNLMRQAQQQRGQ